MEQLQIVYKNPADLSVHQSIKCLPSWADTDPHFKQLVNDIKSLGFLQPAIVTPDWEVVDGRHRLRVAKRLQIDLPCIVKPFEDAASIAISTMVNRKHYTAGQRAYVTAALANEAFAESTRRRLGNLKVGNHPSGGPDANSVRIGEPKRVEMPGLGSLKTIGEWADEAGVSRRYLEMAKEIREFLYITHPDKKWKWNDSITLAGLGVDADAQLTFREYFEPQIMREENPLGLGEVKKAIGARLQQEAAEKAGKVHGGGPPKEEAKQLRLFNDLWDTAANRWEYWQGFSEESKAAAKTHMRTIFTATPPEVRAEVGLSVVAVASDDELETLRKAVQTEKKRRKKMLKAKR